MCIYKSFALVRTGLNNEEEEINSIKYIETETKNRNNEKKKNCLLME